MRPSRRHSHAATLVATFPGPESTSCSGILRSRMFAVYHALFNSHWQALGSNTPLGLSWLSFSAAPRLTESPLVSASGTTGHPAATSPRQQRCANSSSKWKGQALTPSTGVLRNKLRFNRCSVCSRTLLAASPALFRHGLLSSITLKKEFPSRPDSGRG